MIVGFDGKPHHCSEWDGEGSCGKPATRQYRYMLLGVVTWAYKCDEHAAAFAERLGHEHGRLLEEIPMVVVKG